MVEQQFAVKNKENQAARSEIQGSDEASRCCGQQGEPSGGTAVRSEEQGEPSAPSSQYKAQKKQAGAA